MATLEQYNKWRNILTNLIDKAVMATKSVSPEKASVYKILSQQLREDMLKIQVVGTVKNGKSSFTNALIGESILPVDDLPCTAIVSEIKYGPEKKAMISFYSPLPTGLLDEIPPETKRYLQKHNLGKDAKGQDVRIPKLEIPYTRMSDYVALPEAPMEVLMDGEKFRQYRERIAENSPYDTADVEYPAEILKDGVSLVDSPGLNEHSKRTAVTLDYLKKADASIYLLNASAPVTEEEKKVIEEVLLPLGFTDLIMVGNKIDLVQKRERQRLFMQASVESYTTQKHFFAVSAKEYHDGVKMRNEDLIKQSGINEFKDYLIDFITRKKSELRINKTANQVINSLRSEFLDSLIPSRLAALEVDIATLQKRINDATPQLTALEARREQMELAFKRNIPLAMTPIREAVTKFFEKLEKQVREWITSYQPKHDCGMFVSKADINVLADEILEFSKGKVEVAFNKWNEETFQGVLKDQCDLIFGNVKKDTMDMAKEISVIDNLLNGVKNSQGVEPTTVMERMAGIAAMAFLPFGRAGGDLFSGGFELGRFLKTFSVDLGVSIGVGLLALWLWPPLGFIASICGILAGLMMGVTRKIEKLKEQLIQKIVENIHNEAPVKTANMLAEIRTTFDQIQSSIMTGVDSEIAATKAQLRELIRITKGEVDSINQKKQNLHQLNATLASIVGELETLTKDVKAQSKTEESTDKK